ncbi:MAG: NADH:ubiquinone reductase (Na(+)-transporting) subunit C [Saprospiraceae bacterium]|nr:NADH:ubiquinone reductase (Na(+)-transporting) subunit C [Saprospiraceae bacterium]
MHNTRYTLIFTLVLTIVSATILSLLFFGTKDRADLAAKIFEKRAILSSVGTLLDKDVSQMTDQEVLDIFKNQVEQEAVDAQGNVVESAKITQSGYNGGLPEDIEMAKERKKPEDQRIYPVYIFSANGEKVYILSVRGNGLWDEIWGNVAVKSDFNTIVGASFDHKGETPGLGAEIKDNPAFSARFRGKELYDNQGQYTSVAVVKGGVKDPDHQVDGISGATITSNGVTEMLYRGLKEYEPFFNKEKG